MDVKVQNNICILRDDSAFAGSVATMDLCVRTLYHAAGIPLHDAIAICSLTPAKVIGLQDTLGVLAEGYEADVNVFDEGINILYTLIQGEEYQNKL
ncbi:MAG: amidohydrolase family protein, partial [Clostridiales bacterium]|jgi:N-acetylglucosamine-6-phosphate deacetylase|nr:amidohydrolase family protein [Clostridiales bacterium]